MCMYLLNVNINVIDLKKKKRIVASEPKSTDLGTVHPYQTTAEKKKHKDGRKLAQSQIQFSGSHAHRSRDVTL